MECARIDGGGEAIGLTIQQQMPNKPACWHMVVYKCDTTGVFL